MQSDQLYQMYWIINKTNLNHDCTFSANVWDFLALKISILKNKPSKPRLKYIHSHTVNAKANRCVSWQMNIQIQHSTADELTFARAWKLNVRTYSPRRVSLCLTRNTPCPSRPCWRTSCAASMRDKVPWNHGYSCRLWSPFVAPAAAPPVSDAAAPTKSLAVTNNSKQFRVGAWQIHSNTRNVLDCNQSNYSSRIIFSCTFALG